jgi:hypothetical protein
VFIYLFFDAKTRGGVRHSDSKTFIKETNNKSLGRYLQKRGGGKKEEGRDYPPMEGR